MNVLKNIHHLSGSTQLPLIKKSRKEHLRTLAPFADFQEILLIDVMNLKYLSNVILNIFNRRI